MKRIFCFVIPALFSSTSTLFTLLWRYSCLSLCKHTSINLYSGIKENFLLWWNCCEWSILLQPTCSKSVCNDRFVSQQVLVFFFWKASKLCYLEQEVIWPLTTQQFAKEVKRVILLDLLIMLIIFYYIWFHCLQYTFFLNYGNILLVNLF